MKLRHTKQNVPVFGPPCTNDYYSNNNHQTVQIEKAFVDFISSVRYIIMCMC